METLMIYKMCDEQLLRKEVRKENKNIWSFEEEVYSYLGIYTQDTARLLMDRYHPGNDELI